MTSPQTSKSTSTSRSQTHTLDSYLSSSSKGLFAVRRSPIPTLTSVEDSTALTMQKPVLPRLSLPNTSQYPTVPCLSTSSRPRGSGAGLGGSPSHRVAPHYRHLSPPAQPPPLPPPPLSPQLTPLKARLARSKSVSGSVSRSRRSPSTFAAATSVSERRKRLSSRGGHKNQDVRGVSDRNAPGDRNIHNGFERDLHDPGFTWSKINRKSAFEFAAPSDYNDSLVGTTALRLPATVPPTAFSPIIHSRERSAITVCLVSAAFLSASVVVTTILSVILLPVVFFACLVRRIVYWFSNLLLLHYNVCCECGRSQSMTSNSWNLLRPFSLGHSSESDARQCHCVLHSGHAPAPVQPGPSHCCSGQTFCPLSAAELRWLSSGATSDSVTSQRHSMEARLQSHLTQATLEPHLLPVKSPVIVICLRFGAPGISLSRLRDLIARRLLTLQRHSSSHLSSLTSSPRSSSFSDKRGFFGESSTISSGHRSHRTPSPQQRSNSLIPPSDTASRLTQCLVGLPTGYGWRDCLAFRLDEHVVGVTSDGFPSSTPGKTLAEANDDEDHRSAGSRGRLMRSSSATTPTGKRADRKTKKPKRALDDSLPPPAVDVEDLVTRLSRIPFQHNRPLWQAHLVERYQETESSVELLSDAESGAEDSEDLGTSEVVNSSVASKVYNRSASNKCQKASDLKPPRSSAWKSVGGRAAGSEVGPVRRVGGAGVGSLLVFRLHAAVSDDARAVVHLLTNCLADTKLTSSSHTRSPTTTGRSAQADCRLASTTGLQQRWRGQQQVGETRGECQVLMVDEKVKGTNHPHKTTTNTGNGSERSLPSSESTPPTVNRSYLTNCPSTTAANSGARLQSSDERSSTQGVRGFAPTLATNTSTSPSRPTEKRPEIHPPAINSPPESLATGLDYNDDELDELATAQWWYSFWSSSLATIATICDMVRALLTGPIIVLHKYLFTRADMGVLAVRLPAYVGGQRQSSATTEDTGSSGAWAETGARSPRPVAYRCTLLSLLKLSRIRQVTKASYSEIVLSLLAGGLRAYHQNIGVQHPPDLLAILSTEVPALPDCSLRNQEQAVHNRARHPTGGWSANSNTTETSSLPSGRPSQVLPVSNSCASRELRPGQQAVSDHLLESGLLHTDVRRHATLPSPPPLPANTLRPGRHILVDVCLPLNTEGMLPRLWETRQRLLELSRSIEPLCLSWARSLIYTVMPHFLADWLETTLGSSAKASVNVTSVEVVSPFSQSKEADEATALSTYQMSAVRRLAYMSLLDSKSAEARSLRRRLQKRLPRTGQVTRSDCPPRQGTSFRAMARHLANANAGLVYVAGSPIIRIDTWMPSARQVNLPGSPRCGQHFQQQQLQKETTSLGISTNDSTETTVSCLGTDNWLVCRDLSVTFTTYAGHLSLTLSADAAMDGMHPNLDLIIQAMRTQLRKMHRLLAGRYVPTAPHRWLHCAPQWDTGGVNRFIQNSNAIWNGRTEQTRVSSPEADCSTPTTNKEHNPPGTLTRSQSNTVFINAGPEPSTNEDSQKLVTKGSRIQSKYLPSMKKVLSMSSVQILSKSGTYSVDEVEAEAHTSIRPTNLSEVRRKQPTEQLQDRLRWVQQQLTEAAVNPSQMVKTTTGQTNISPDRLIALRTEFSTLLRELKQRCSPGSLGISPDTQPAFDFHGAEPTTHPPGHYTSSTSVTILSHCVNQEGVKEKAIIHGQPDATQSTAEIAGPRVGYPVAVDYSSNLKHLAFPTSGGDFDEDPDFHIGGCSEDEELEFEHPILVNCSHSTSEFGHHDRPHSAARIKRRSSSLLQMPTVATSGFDPNPDRRGSSCTTTTTTAVCTPTGGGILAKIAKLTTTSSSSVICSPTTCSSSLTVRLSRR